jgi:hypothetical protein
MYRSFAFGVNKGRPLNIVVCRHMARNDYLYFVDGIWMIGPEPGRRAAGLFVQDEAWRPEHILSQWYVAMTTSGRVETDSQMNVVCLGT